MGTTLNINQATGLTDNEQGIMDSLVSAAEGFCNLIPIQHPSDRDEFIEAIHRCQDLLALRVVRRAYPVGWHNENLYPIGTDTRRK